jgi:hypothetical protein
VRELRRLAGEHDVDAIEPALEVRCDLERVAAVVPRAGEDEDAAPARARKLPCELRGGKARPFHQRRAGIVLQRGRLERADTGSQIKGRQRGGHRRAQFNRAQPALGVALERQAHVLEHVRVPMLGREIAKAEQSFLVESKEVCARNNRRIFAAGPEDLEYHCGDC